jgi:hypothetical protein
MKSLDITILKKVCDLIKIYKTPNGYLFPSDFPLHLCELEIDFLEILFSKE